MTDTELQEILAQEMRKLVEDDGIMEVKDNIFKSLHVFKQDLPLKLSDEDDPDRDGQFNYLVVMLGDEDLKDGEWDVEIHFSVGLEYWDDESQGNIHVANVMNQIFLHLVSTGIIAERCSMDVTRASKRFNLAAEPPYYEGDLITHWKLPVPETDMERDDFTW